MEVKIAVQGDAVRCTVRGELDLVGAPRLRAELDARWSPAVHELVLDLSEVTFVDSSGLGVILTCYRRLCAQEGRMRIVGASPMVRRVLEMSGVTALIPVGEKRTP